MNSLAWFILFLFIFVLLYKRSELPSWHLRLSVFVIVTSSYTAVYGEIQYENGPYCAIILITIIWYRIQCRVYIIYSRMYTMFSLNTIVKHQSGLRWNMMRKRPVYHRLWSYKYRIVRPGLWNGIIKSQLCLPLTRYHRKIM
jgi:hypothetical protein